MPVRRYCSLARRLALVLAFAGACPGLRAADSPPAEPQNFSLTAEADARIDAGTGEAVFTKNARLVFGEWTIVADEIRYNQRTREAGASGNVLVSRAGLRLLGDTAHYRLNDRFLEVTGVRFGRPPVNIAGARAYGTAEQMTIEQADVFYGEPDVLTPRASARKLRVFKDDRIEAEGLRLAVGSIPVAGFAGFTRPLAAPTAQWRARGGYDSNLGLQLGASAYLPVAPGLWAGGSLDEFTQRGLLFGPGARYDVAKGATSLRGATDFAYIHDTGDRLTDVLGEPIEARRYFGSWQHQQRTGDEFTLNGELNAWSDSEVLRDFRDDVFNRDQQPDNFLEASWNGSNTIVSAFTRFRPNDFQFVPERLPELRLDVLPTPVGATGALFQLNAGAAALRETSPLDDSELRSDRFDLYAGASRTFTLTRGVTVTPVAGGRFTYYNRAEGGRDDYTRLLGEIGFDARLRAYRVMDLDKPLWGIDGLRHVVEPRIEYRYVPSANRGRAYIPPIDERAFLSRLQPLGLADRRDIDALDEIHAVRFGLKNLLETRRPDYGSRELVQFDLAADFSFSKPDGADDTSDVQAELKLTPAHWFSWWFFARVDPGDAELHEFNTRVMLVDGRNWSAGVDGDLLESDLGQVQLFGHYELSEASSLHASVRYDARQDRFNEVNVALYRRLSQTWLARIGVTLRDGPRRESSFGLRLDLRFLEF